MHRRVLCCSLFFLGLTTLLFGCAAPHPEAGKVAPTGEAPQRVPTEKSRTPSPPALWRGPDEPPPGLRSAELERLRQSEQTAGSWTLFGPTDVPGRLSSMAIDPFDAQRIWIGSAAGGVFRTDDGGSAWTPVFDDQALFSIGAVAVDPSNPDTVYVGTGEETGSVYNFEGEGVFKTTDAGVTWSYVGLAEVRRIGRIAIDPVDPQRVFVAGGGSLWNEDEHRGVYRSLDGGGSWNRVLHVSNRAGAVDVRIDPSDPDRVYAAVWQRSWGGGFIVGGPDSGIYRSLDGGTTWSQLTAGLPAGPLGRIGLAVAPSAPRHVYAIIGAEISGVLGVWRSDDSGDSWSLVSTPYVGSSAWYFGQIRVDPTDWKIVYALDVFLWESINAGFTFTQRTTYHADHHDLIISGNSLLIANDGGYGEVDATDVSRFDTPNTQFYDICTDQQDPARLLGGTQDNGLLRTDDGGVSWTREFAGDAYTCLIDPQDSNRVYGQWLGGEIRRSIDGGMAWSLAMTGIDTAEDRALVVPMVFDPANSSTLYMGRERVYRSVDAALSWVPISDPLGSGSPTAWHSRGVITALAVSPQDPQLLWAGTDDGNVWFSDDGGASWNAANPPGLSYWVTGIAPDPFDRNDAYLTVAGFRLGDTMPYVRRTDDLGSTWTDVSDGGLPALPINTILADDTWRGRVFVGSDLGVHLSDDAGESWALLGDGMPAAPVLDLELNQTSMELFAATHGRSIYSFDVTQLGPADGDGDGVDNNTDCALADPGAFAPPGAVQSLHVDRLVGGDAELTWTDLGATAGTGTVYDVAASGLADLALTGAAGGELVCGTSATTVVDGESLSPGTGKAYLVRGKNSCALGGWGADGQGNERVSSACLATASPGRDGGSTGLTPPQETRTVVLYSSSRAGRCPTERHTHKPGQNWRVSATRLRKPGSPTSSNGATERTSR